MKDEKIKMFSFGILLGVILTSSIGFAILEPAFDKTRRELVASRNDALEYRQRYDAIKSKLDKGIGIIDGSQELISGTIGTIQQALATIRECRRIILDLKRTLQRE